MYSEEQSTGKYKKWAVLSYVFAAISALGLIGSVIEWIAWKSDAFLSISNFVWRLLRLSSSSAFHLVMVAVVILFAAGTFTNIFGGYLLKSQRKSGNAMYILSAILDGVGALCWGGIGIFALVDGIGAYDKTYQTIAIVMGVFGILTLVAMAISTIILFQKCFSGEETIEAQQGSDIVLPPLGQKDPEDGPFMGQAGMGVSPISPVKNVPPVVEKPPVVPAFENPQKINVPKQSQQPQQPMGRIKVTKGMAIGQAGYKFPATNKIVVGKNPKSCNLVVQNPHVSNIHCSVRYNAAGNTYIIKDHSTNGTFVGNVRLPKGIPAEYPAGTVLSLANGDTQVTLG